MTSSYPSAISRLVSIRAATGEGTHFLLYTIRSIAGLPTNHFLADYLDWPGLAQMLCLERRVANTRSGIARRETAYAITSLAPARAAPAQLLTAWCAHWHIENTLQYVRDVTFDEDRSQARAQQIQHVMASLRNTAIGLLRIAQQPNISPQPAGATPHNPRSHSRRLDSNENE